ncbi:DUF4380 domain-containing protein [Actinoalloteichus hymeniacidonis]|uniref:DUF4380 family protein n=1 Tax=Actinoalloteichus hymeniacidonis TaxID=340345 RepID=A0AAC9HPV9_9PSEU|nr:DUF4380 domain-containing protein [Actinoalloteichus hymeniacidonis]AOS63304.1 putative DUF4380 family protein [Actinoalloteichus hymeniacidonis]MBB5908657.1 hypothetical protein [Actinoalloteichus hymeniacidonis]
MTPSSSSPQDGAAAEQRTPSDSTGADTRAAARVTPSGEVRIERDTSGPYDVFHLDNGTLRIGIVPALGGRVLSVVFHGREYLYRNPRLLDDRLHPVDGRRPRPTSGPMSEWLNFGGDKTWPAPQGWDGPDQWAGPPDPVLDSGSYQARTRVDGEAVEIVMTSGDDPRTGLRTVRTVRLVAGESRYTLEIAFTNIERKPVRWGLWNVTQLAGEPPAEAGPTAGVYVGLLESGLPRSVELITAGPAPSVIDEGGSVVRVAAQDVVGKVGFPDAAGWLADVGAHGTLTQTFPVDVTAEYPDAGSRVEVWLEHPLTSPIAELGNLLPRDRVVECEALGPLTTLQPGERTTLPVVFGFGVTASPVAAVTAAGYWTEPATGIVTAEGGRELRGVFVPGTGSRLHARFLDAAGEVVDSADLAELTPGRPCALPVGRAVPHDAVTVDLTVSGEPIGTLTWPVSTSAGAQSKIGTTEAEPAEPTAGVTEETGRDR